MSALIAHDRYAEAEAVARTRLAARPDDADALRALTTALAGQHLFAAARAAGNEAIAVAPDDWRAYAQRVEVDLRAHDADERTLELAQRAAQLAPDAPPTHHALGRAAFEVGDLALADRAFSAMLRLSPDDAIACYNTGLARARRLRLMSAARLLAETRRREPAELPWRGPLTLVLARWLMTIQFVVLTALVLVFGRPAAAGGVVAAMIVAVLALGAVMTRALGRDAGGALREVARGNRGLGVITVGVLAGAALLVAAPFGADPEPWAIASFVVQLAAGGLGQLIARRR